MNQADRIRIFAEELWTWFDQNKRTLPWRDLVEKDDDHRAYLVLVSEIMLQQTQVSRVIDLYQKFIQTFPHLESLSKASNAEILRAWKGLGYNSRALRLRDAARTIHNDFAGQFPRTQGELVTIKGIGDYTAGALLNFAFDIPTPCIDVNIRRIVHRFFYGPEQADGTFAHSDTELTNVLQSIMDTALLMKRRTAKDFFSALMDFGSLVCTKNNPKWELFSPGMQSACKAYGKEIKRTKKVNKKEPGSLILGRFIPERLTRGKIIEFLRSHPDGARVSAIGEAIRNDWEKSKDAWLRDILSRLCRDELVQRRSKIYRL